MNDEKAVQAYTRYAVAAVVVLLLLVASYKVNGLYAELVNTTRERDKLKAELAKHKADQHGDQIAREVRLRLKEIRAELSNPDKDRKEVCDRYEQELMRMLRLHRGKALPADPLE